MDKRPTFEEYFMGIAKQVSTRSNCLRAQVGAVIVSSDNYIQSTGYNGTPSKVKSCREIGSCYRQENNIASGTMYETCQSIHAEQNAIIQTGIKNCKRGTIFIYGHDEVCIMCTRMIIQAGIEHIFLQKDDIGCVKYMSINDLRRKLER